MKVVRSLALRTGRLYPQEFSWYSFLDAESTPGHMVPSVASEKNPSDTTGDRSRDLPTHRGVLTAVLPQAQGNANTVRILQLNCIFGRLLSRR